MSVLKDPLPRKIAVVRMLPGLGDFLVIVPALRAIRSALPEASITLIGLEPAREFCMRFKYYFNFFERSPGFPGIPECEPETHVIPHFLKRMQASDFDLAIQMHGDGTISNIFTALLRAGTIAGYYREGNYCPDPAHFLKYEDRESEVLRYMRLVQSLGLTPQGQELEFPLTKGDKNGLTEIDACRALSPQSYVCIHPGASTEEKRWPCERFAAVADELSQQGWQIVLTGTRSEIGLCSRIENAMQRKPMNLAGRTSLGKLAMLISDSALVICNDTGISHLASALNVASVVIFTASDPTRWAPLNRNLHRAVHLADNDDRAGLLKGDKESSLNSEHLPAVDTVLAETESLLKPKRRNFA
jgi:ADP-heptose:LPS heptosyltransferase